MENRQHERAKVKSILVSLKNDQQQISGFLRDISEGGLKIQRISAERQVETGDYECHFILPNMGKIQTKVEVVGMGEGQERMAEMFVRVRFYDLNPEFKEKIKKFVEQSQSS